MKPKIFNWIRWCLLTLSLAVAAMAKAQTDSVEDLLNGRFSGVQILSDDGAPGSAFSVRIRGLRSFRGDSQPLYVLDGVLLNSPLSDVDRTFWNDGHDYQALQNTLDNINPDDIADIKVLKDAAATAIYGSFGGNGVIVITTKKGSQTGLKTDWRSVLSLNEAMRFSHRHHVSVSGGNTKGTYYISAGYRNTEGVLQRSSLDLATLDAKYEQAFGMTGKFGVSFMLGLRDNSMVMATSPLGSNSTVKSLWDVRPVPSEDISVWNAAYDDDSRQYSVIPNLYVDAGLGAGFRFNVNAGFDFRNKTRLRWAGPELQRASELEGLAGQSCGNAIRYNADASIAYSMDNKGHSLDARAGTQAVGGFFNEYIYEGSKFFSQNLRAKGISLAENVSPYRHVENNDLNVSLFLVAEYNYRGRYFAGGSIRTEMDSRFDRSFTWHSLYPSAYLGWNIAEEPFMKSQKIVNNLKVTAGWGKSGVSQVLPYGYDYNYITGVEPDFYAEGLMNYYDMRWSNVAEQYNAGLDIAFLDDRITANASVYRCVAKDELAYYFHTPETGYDAVYSNHASIMNRGVEVSLQADAVRCGDFIWSIGANFAYNHNEIISTGAENDVLGNPVGKWDGEDIVVNVNRAGYSVGAFYGYMSQGTLGAVHTLLAPAFFGTRLKEGDVKFIDINGDGNVTMEDMTVIGNSLPKYIFAFNTEFSWKSLSLYALFDGASGYRVANLRKFYTDNGVNMENAVGLDVFSSRLLEDGSYLRLSELKLSYRMNMDKVKWMDSVGISLSARNLCAFTRYSGAAPYVSSYGFDLSRMGIDNGAYPVYRSFLLGLNLRF